MKSIPQKANPRHIAGIFSSSETLLDADGGTEHRETIHLRIYKTILESGMLAELKGAPLSVLLAIALYANGKGKAWPSAYTLSQNTGYSENTVRAACRKLEDLGWIERQQQRNEGGLWSHTIYTIKAPANRHTKNGQPLNGQPSIGDEVLPSLEGVSKGEGNARGGSTAESETAATCEEKHPPPPSEIIKKIQTQLDSLGEPNPEQTEELAALHERHGEQLGRILEFTFADFLPTDSWMNGKPLTWGTVLHILPDAVAAFRNRRAVYHWTCPECGAECEARQTFEDSRGRRKGLLCGDCGTVESVENGRKSPARPAAAATL